MGIKDIKTLVGEKCTTTKIINFKDKKVLVDASIYLYRFTYRAPSPEDSTRYVIDGFLQQLKIFKKYNIVPVYVFDGAATQHKKVLEERAEKRKKIAQRAELTRQEVIEIEKEIEKEMQFLLNIEFNDNETKPIKEPIEEIIDESIKASIEETIDESIGKTIGGENESQGDEFQGDEFQGNENMRKLSEIKTRQLSEQLDVKRDSIYKLEKQIRKPTSENIRTSIKLFKLLGVPHIVSPVESDALCAYLTQTKKVDVVFTEDTDMIPLRCPSFVSGFDKERAVLSEFRVDHILENLKITYEQLVDVCILCGCDYADKITQIGPKRALPLIKKYGTIENIIEKYIKNDAKLVEKHTYHETFIDQVKQARIMFYTAHNINDYLETHNIVAQTANFQWTIPRDIHNEFNELLGSIGMTKDAHIRWGKSLGLF